MGFVRVGERIAFRRMRMAVAVSRARRERKIRRASIFVAGCGCWCWSGELVGGREKVLLPLVGGRGGV